MYDTIIKTIGEKQVTFKPALNAGETMQLARIEIKRGKGLVDEIDMQEALLKMCIISIDGCTNSEDNLKTILKGTPADLAIYTEHCGDIVDKSMQGIDPEKKTK